jgi:effector-binding domain-containing protein
VDGEYQNEPHQHVPRGDGRALHGCGGTRRACAGAVAGPVGLPGRQPDAKPDPVGGTCAAPGRDQVSGRHPHGGKGSDAHTAASGPQRADGRSFRRGIPPTPPPPAPSTQTADPFGEEFSLQPKKVVSIKGTATWDAAFDTLIESFKALTALLDKQGVKPSGNAMIVYTSTDDNGFTYLAQFPVDADVKNLTKDMSMGKSPEGKALKFVHRGSYDNMDNTYEAITNHLDDKKLEAKDTFIEEYMTDPLKTAEDKLVINVYVPLR